MKHLILLFLALVSLSLSSCNIIDEPTTPTDNPSKYITDPEKREMITSLTDLDDGKIYTMHYTMDYKLQAAIDASSTDMKSFNKNIMGLLYDINTTNNMFYGTGCSAFAATLSKSGKYVMGRNYDYCHKEGDKEVPTALIVVYTTSKNGKKTIGFVDGYFLGLCKGFYTDGKTDLSTLMFAPYLVVDGMNEDGLAISTLALDGKPTDQSETGKQDIYVSVAVRAVLDRCSTVDEAIEFLKGYNMHMTTVADCSLHFLLADAKGDYAVIEWSFKDAKNVDESSVPEVFTPLQADANRYVTNFYVDPRLNDCMYGGLSSHGRDRYNTLRDTMEFYSYKLTEQQVKSLLEAVSQASNPQEPTSHTQWSNVYNLSDRIVKTAILQEYDKWYEFNL